MDFIISPPLSGWRNKKMKIQAYTWAVHLPLYVQWICNVCTLVYGYFQLLYVLFYHHRHHLHYVPFHRCLRCKI